MHWSSRCNESLKAMVYHILKYIDLNHVFVAQVSISRSCSPLSSRFWRLVSRAPLSPTFPSPCSSACTIMIVFPSCCCCSYWVTHIQLQISVNPCFLRPPFVSAPPPLEIIMVAAQCLGVKLWSLGRAALIIYPFSCVHRAVGSRFAICEIWTDFCSI